MAILIRPVVEDDLEKVGQLYSKVYTSKDFDKFTPAVSIEYIAWIYRRCPELAFVAVDGQKIVGGYLAAIKPWFNGPHVVDGEIFVDNDYRRQGIGLRLTQTLLLQAKEKFGASEVEALAFTDEVGPEFSSVRWHEKNGRHIIKELVLVEGSIEETLVIIDQRIKRTSTQS